MPGPSSAGGITRHLRDERGAVLVLMAGVCFILTLLFMGICEFGRYLIAREQTQTAADAAAHAAMLTSAERMVKLRIFTTPDTEWLNPCGCECCSDDGCFCCACCVPCYNEIIVTGTMKFLLDQGGWMTYWPVVCSACPGCSCDIDYEILDHWVKIDSSTAEAAADAYYEANRPDQALDSGIRSVQVYPRDSKYGPSVVVRAWYKVASLFPGVFGIFPESYGGSRGKVCSQADVFYKDPEGDKYIADKYRRSAPKDACWYEGF